MHVWQMPDTQCEFVGIGGQCQPETQTGPLPVGIFQRDCYVASKQKEKEQANNELDSRSGFTSVHFRFHFPFYRIQSSSNSTKLTG